MATRRNTRYWEQQSRLWLPVLGESGFTDLAMLPQLRNRLPPDLRPVEGIHAVGVQDGKRSLFALRSLNHEPDDYWRRVYQRQVSFGFSRSRGTPAEWSEFFSHGLGTRFYGYGWRSEEEEALDVWAIIDIEVLSQLEGKGVPLSAGRVRHGRAQSFIAFNLRQLREAAKPAELVPHYSPGHPGLSGMPFAYGS